MLKEFHELMEAYARADSAEDRQALEDRVWRTYGMEQAVFILDMTGFSRLTESHGIVRYLSMVRHMQLTVQPIVERFQGKVVKFEADNCFGRFPDALNAVQAAIASNIALDTLNMMTDDELDIHVSVGIDFGKFLLVDEEDYFGSPVNLASKLGEDLAEGGEILLTKQAFAGIPEDAGIRSEPASYRISGVNIDAHRIIY